MIKMTKAAKEKSIRKTVSIMSDAIKEAGGSVSVKPVSLVGRLTVGTVVVHNYGEFTHGVILEVLHDAYSVYFPDDMCPDIPKYQNNTIEAMKARIRTITHGKGFFVSRFKTLNEVRSAQHLCKLMGMDLEGNKF
jgi:hypothetical protein